jgi:hypothetical protein
MPLAARIAPSPSGNGKNAGSASAVGWMEDLQ